MEYIELKRCNEFLLNLIFLEQKGKIKRNYRGDSLMNLCEKLNVNYLQENTDIDILKDRLFMVGDKSKRYYIDDNNFEIDDYQDIVFEKIIKYFRDSITNKNKNVITFFEQNRMLKDFFWNKNNKLKFIQIINEIPTYERLIIRDYYLTLLHQLAAINYKNKSHFNSTSKDYRIAEKFSKSNRNKENII